MKKIAFILFCTSSIHSMEDVAAAAVQRYRERNRDIFFNEVPQAKTAQGFQQAFDYFFELSEHEMIPGVTFVCAKGFYEEHGHKYPEIAQVIVRFHNCVIEKAFSMQEKGKEAIEALKAVTTNAKDRSYILSGRRNLTLDENELAKKTSAVAEIINNNRPYFGVMD